TLTIVCTDGVPTQAYTQSIAISMPLIINIDYDIGARSDKIANSFDRLPTTDLSDPNGIEPICPTVGGSASLAHSRCANIHGCSQRQLHQCPGDINRAIQADYSGLQWKACQCTSEQCLCVHLHLFQ